jgi:hypothetical protein
VVVLHYDAAWAILRCCHVDEHGSFEEILPSGDLYAESDQYLSRPSQAPSQIDCLDSDYRVQLSAGPASPPQINRGTAARALYVDDLFGPKGMPNVSWKTSGGNIPTRGSPNFERSVGPLYLYLASLRI